MSSETNLFEIASREAYRYNSSKGAITTENLWALPLTSRDGMNLDDIGMAIIAELDSTKTGSLVVANKDSAKKKELAQKLEIVKTVIAYKQAQQDAAKSATARKEEKERLLNLLEKKEEEKLGSLSAEEIKARLAALS